MVNAFLLNGTAVNDFEDLWTSKRDWKSRRVEEREERNKNG